MQMACQEHADPSCTHGHEESKYLTIAVAVENRPPKPVYCICLFVFLGDAEKCNN